MLEDNVFDFSLSDSRIDNHHKIGNFHLRSSQGTVSPYKSSAENENQFGQDVIC